MPSDDPTAASAAAYDTADVERAAAAMWEAVPVPIQGRWAQLGDRAKDEWRIRARAALDAVTAAEDDGTGP